MQCARRGSPSGGPIDETPPKVVRLEPNQKTLNFNSDLKDSITFDEAAFDKVVAERITEAQKTEVIEIDTELDFSDITTGFNNVLKQFEPFGPENMSPLFVTKNVMDRGYSKVVGSDNEHLKLHMCTEKEKLSEMNGIAFKLGFHSEYVSKGLAFDICYAIQENEWKGKRSIQLAVKDLKTF